MKDKTEVHETDKQVGQTEAEKPQNSAVQDHQLRANGVCEGSISDRTRTHINLRSVYCRLQVSFALSTQKATYLCHLAKCRLFTIVKAQLN